MPTASDAAPAASAKAAPTANVLATRFTYFLTKCSTGGSLKMSVV